MGVPKRLTEMQQRFAEYLVFGANQPSHRLVLKTQPPRIPIIMPDKLMKSDV